MENKEIENDESKDMEKEIIKKEELTIFNGNNTIKYCSKKVIDEQEKKELFNALESCDVLLNDCAGQEIEIKDVYIEEREIIDEETGEIKPKYRTIIFDKNGQTYVTTSYGIINVLNKIFQVYGFPTEWKKPLKVKVLKKSIGNDKQILTLILV